MGFEGVPKEMKAVQVVEVCIAYCSCNECRTDGKVQQTVQDTPSSDAQRTR